MGRRKKEDIEKEIAEKKAVVHSDAKRGATAIFLFALAILFVLGFFEQAGLLGEYRHGGRILVRLGKMAFPIRFNRSRHHFAFPQGSAFLYFQNHRSFHSFFQRPGFLPYLFR